MITSNNRDNGNNNDDNNNNNDHHNDNDINMAILDSLVFFWILWYSSGILW